MKKTVSYNIKKVLAGTMLVALPFAFGGCEEDPVKPENKKHNVELKYDGRTAAGCVNVAMDTIYKYNSDPTVDSIFMIPDPINQFATANSQYMRNVVNYLRERHNVNPNKVFGKGDIVLNNMVIDQNPEIVRFFADTLRYNVR
ncbi:MAG: hypothetical protein ACLRFM_01640 [Alphaproteobacteria bacterium]